MKIIGYNCIPKSSILIVHHELSSRMFCKPKLLISSYYQKRNNFFTTLQCSVASRPYASSSNAARSNKKQEKSSSLYGRASLLEMKNERIANRARVYDFLRSIGIEPDELDGLELPVTVDVMKERVDFLHTLGLTIEDINNYPLVLGCSVKKNMIPVLDYLGKLGVKRSILTDFLRRYPQVLHASVVVDLAPVVKYLEGIFMSRKGNIIVATGLLAFASAGLAFPFYMATRSSKAPIIDSSKPLSPQATFRGPYINSGSRDVGPDYQTYSKK